MITFKETRWPSKKIIIYDNNEPVGYCQYKMIGDIVHIKLINIEKENRRKGYATRLVDHIVKTKGNVRLNYDDCTNIGLKFFTTIMQYYPVLICKK